MHFATHCGDGIAHRDRISRRISTEVRGTRVAPIVVSGRVAILAIAPAVLPGATTSPIRPTIGRREVINNLPAPPLTDQSRTSPVSQDIS